MCHENFVTDDWKILSIEKQPMLSIPQNMAGTFFGTRGEAKSQQSLFYHYAILISLAEFRRRYKICIKIVTFFSLMTEEGISPVQPWLHLGHTCLALRYLDR